MVRGSGDFARHCQQSGSGGGRVSLMWQRWGGGASPCAAVAVAGYMLIHMVVVAGGFYGSNGEVLVVGG